MNNDEITCLIVEDDPAATEALKVLLEQHKQIKVTATARNATEAYSIAVKENPDLIFLDVELPGKNGIDFLDLILREGLHPTVIFTTAYDHYAIEAIRHSAIDYLLKPIDPEELSIAVAKYNRQRSHQEIEKNLHSIIENLKAPKLLKFNSNKGFVMIDPREIVYCHADWNYTEIYYGDDFKELVTVNLGKVTELLMRNHQFIRVGRSFMINISYLLRVDKKQHICILKKGNKEFPIEISSLNLRKLENVVSRLTSGVK